MATNTIDEKPAKSGENTVEHKRVHTNLSSVVMSLEANTDAFKSLCRKVKEKRWIQKLDVTPDYLLNVVCDRIRLNIQTYNEFMDILGNVEGLDLIKDTIENTNFPVQETREDAKEEKETLQSHDSGQVSDAEPEPFPEQKSQEAHQDVKPPLGPEHRDEGQAQESARANHDFEDFVEHTEQDGDDLGAPLTQSSYEQASGHQESQRTVVTGLRTDHQQENVLTEKVALNAKLKAKEKELEVLRNIIVRQHRQIEELQKLRQTNENLEEKLQKALVDKKEAESKHASLSAEVKVLQRRLSELDIKVEELQKKCAESDERDRKRDIAEQERRAADKAYMDKHLEELRKMEEKREKEHAEVMDAFKQLNMQK